MHLLMDDERQTLGLGFVKALPSSDRLRGAQRSKSPPSSAPGGWKATERAMRTAIRWKGHRHARNGKDRDQQLRHHAYSTGGGGALAAAAVAVPACGCVQELHACCSPATSRYSMLPRASGLAVPSPALA